MPDRVRQFLVAVVDSYEKLVVTMYLRAHPHAWRTAQDIAGALGMQASSVGASLDALRTAGLVGATGDPEPRFSIRLGGPHGPQIEALWRLYEADRSAVIDMMRDAARRARG